MQKDASLYNMTQQLQGAIFQAGFKQYLATLSDGEKNNRPQPPLLLQLRGGYAESPGWMMVQMAEFDPDPLSVDKFRRRAVYSAPKLSLAILEMLASEKWLNRIGDEYHLTQAGREVLDKMQERRQKPFQTFSPIPSEQAYRLEFLTCRVVEASLHSEVVDPWCLSHSRNRAPAGESAPFVKMVQYGSDFNAFRDDVHMCAYGAYNVLGHVWEAFAFVDDEQANNPDDLFDQLAYRGWARSDWAAALDELDGRGWAEKSHGFYQSTEKGKAVREEVEKHTDELFYEPWSILTDAEYDELIDLMQTAMKACQEIIQA